MIRALLRAGILLIVLIQTTGCCHVVKEVNKLYPPKDSCDAQLSSVNAATADLASFTTPAALYAGIAGNDVESQIARVIEPLVPGIRDLNIRTGDQEIVADFEFAGRFLEGKVYAAGHAILHASVAVESSHLIIQPTFEQIKLRRVGYKKSDFPDDIVGPINTALRTFLGNINRALPEQKIQLSTRFVADFDPNTLLKGQTNVESAYGKPIRIDIALGHSSILIDPEGVHVMAELVNRAPDSVFTTPAGALPAAGSCAPGEFPAKFEEFRNRFITKMSADLSSQDEVGWARTSVAVRKSFLAEAVNFYGGAGCVNGEGNCSVLGLTYVLPPIDAAFKSTLTTDPAPDLRCGQNYPGFSPNPCNAGPCNATRDCPGSCAWYDAACHAWKGTCEALKAGEKLACEAREGAKKAACEADNELRRLAYEAEKTARIAGCNLNQGWLNAWQNQDVGDIQGHVALEGARARLDLYGFNVAPDLTSITIASDAVAHSKVRADIEFLPKNFGHALCQARWNARVHADATGTKLTRNMNASLTASREDDGSLILEARPDAQEFELKLSKAPLVSLFEQNPHVVVACVPAVVLGLTGELFGSVQRALGIGNPTSLLTDTFRHRIDNLSFPIRFPRYEIEVPGAPDNSVVLTPEMRPAIVRFTAN